MVALGSSEGRHITVARDGVPLLNADAAVQTLSLVTTRLRFCNAYAWGRNAYALDSNAYALDKTLWNHVNVRPSVRPASVDEIVTLFMDRSPPNLEHSFLVPCTSKIFCAVQSEIVCAHARPLIDRHLRCRVFAPMIFFYFQFINQQWQKYKQWHRNTNKEHTGRKANTGLTNHLCAAKKK